jgi:hypothetical protein
MFLFFFFSFFLLVLRHQQIKNTSTSTPRPATQQTRIQSALKTSWHGDEDMSDDEVSGGEELHHDDIFTIPKIPQRRSVSSSQWGHAAHR